ncbi:unnamed protein product [Brachionus calyciflorus]|uniref:EamA domain-containing protein n=1 Tax=Brachionus calyciflorus TaxID=104777 RepID=A0A814KD02_9BILA|nr:unnamed protein product [Brachionus calyciflorus]
MRNIEKQKIETPLLNNETNLNDQFEEIQNKCSEINLKNRILRYQGILYAFIAIVSIALSRTSVRYCYYFNASEITTLRYLFQFIIMLIIAIYRGENLLGEASDRKILFLRATFGTIGLLTNTISLKMIDPADSASLGSCSIVIVYILSRLILKEKLTLCHLLASFMTLMGVFLISQPSFLVPKIKTNAFNESNGFRKKENFNRIIGNEKKHEVDTIYLINRSIFAIVSSLTGLFSQVCINLAFLHEDVTKVSLIRSTNLLFSFIFQYFLLDIHSNLYSVSGALLILFSVTMILIYKINDQKYVIKYKDYLESKKLIKNEQNDEENYQVENTVKPGLILRILFFKF